jgi:hypothetical protein
LLKGCGARNFVPTIGPVERNKRTWSSTRPLGLVPGEANEPTVPVPLDSPRPKSQPVRESSSLARLARRLLNFRNGQRHL